MWLSHLFFAWNMYKMLVSYKTIDVKEAAIKQLETEEPAFEMNAKIN